MKKITLIFLLFCSIVFGQDLGNPAIIGQTNRNQKVGKGFQIEDTLLTKGKIVFSGLVTYGSTDTILGVKNGIVVRTLPSGGGGGSSALFPNGYNIITEDYEIQSSDEGKLLVTLGDSVTITMPPGIIFTTGKSLGIRIISTGTFQTRNSSDQILSLNQINTGTGIGEYDAETVMFTTLDDFSDGNSALIPLSTSIVNDNGVFKTMLRYLYDKPSGGGSDLATLIDACPNVDLQTLNGSETFPILKDDTVYQLSLGDFANLIGGGGGGVPEAPNDGQLYGRQNNDWSVVPNAELSTDHYDFFADTLCVGTCAEYVGIKRKGSYSGYPTDFGFLATYLPLSNYGYVSMGAANSSIIIDDNDDVQINAQGKFRLSPPDFYTVPKPIGSVLTLIDSTTGECDWQAPVVGDFIPLSGTKVDKPVIGTVQFDIDSDNHIKFTTPNSSDITGYIRNTGSSVQYIAGDDVTKYSISAIIESGSAFNIECLGLNPKGLEGAEDYTANAKTEPLAYTQFAYVGYRGTATLSSGTVTVNTANIHTGYNIYVSYEAFNGTVGSLEAPKASIIDGTSFIINSSTGALDNSTINWWIAP